jgi:hypothetical protein
VDAVGSREQHIRKLAEKLNVHTVFLPEEDPLTSYSHAWGIVVGTKGGVREVCPHLAERGLR